MGRQARLRKARRICMQVVRDHHAAGQLGAVLAADRAPKVTEYEYLLVAEGVTPTQACCYLRDAGVEIVGTIQRDDGRWVVKVVAA